jgi:hypothetical protein
MWKCGAYRGKEESVLDIPEFLDSFVSWFDILRYVYGTATCHVSCKIRSVILGAVLRAPFTCIISQYSSPNVCRPTLGMVEQVQAQKTPKQKRGPVYEPASVVRP